MDLETDQGPTDQGPTDQGPTGHAYVFCYTPIALKPIAELIEALQPLIQGEAVAPLVLAQKLQGRFRLLGPQGFTGIAMAAIDMVAWDVLAKSVGLSLTRFLGGEEKPVPAYQSLGMAGPDGAAQEAAESMTSRFDFGIEAQRPRDQHFSNRH